MQYILLLVFLLLPLGSHARSPFGQPEGGQAVDSGLPDDPAKLQEMIRKLQAEAGKPKVQAPVDNPQGRLIGVINGRKIYEGDLRNPEQFKPSTPTVAPETSGPAQVVKSDPEAKPQKELIRISDLDPEAKSEKTTSKPNKEQRASDQKPVKSKTGRKSVQPQGKPAAGAAPQVDKEIPKKNESEIDEAKGRQEELKNQRVKKGSSKEAAESVKASEQKGIVQPKHVEKKEKPSVETAYFRAGKKAKSIGTAAFRGECEGRFWSKKGGMVQLKPTQPVNIYGYTMGRQECSGGLAYDVGQGFMCGECFDVLSMTTKLPRFEDSK